MRYPFLTAEWRHLAMLNYEIDPAVLLPFVPRGVELDSFGGRYFVSVVGFLFRNTKLLGIPIPWHRHFEEVNLRFYVRRQTNEGWRRGVVFVKEIVPRVAIALTARILYGENYMAAPMWHRIEAQDACANGPLAVSYSWRFHGQEHHVELSADGEAVEIAKGSEVEFITEHYWGYARRRSGWATEYRVEHPRWWVRTATASTLDCDVGVVYGCQFVESLTCPPFSAFLAEGSEVTVFQGSALRA
jgi:uncharacterized protein YqjF (DUF2071 family)